jgi:hypothetical protein
MTSTLGPHYCGPRSIVLLPQERNLIGYNGAVAVNRLHEISSRIHAYRCEQARQII